MDLLPELGSLRSVLPAPTLAHRLVLLREGACFVNTHLTEARVTVCEHLCKTFVDILPKSRVRIVAFCAACTHAGTQAVPAA